MKRNRKVTDLVSAALRLAVPYHTCLRWVLVGQLRGERRRGRWVVFTCDLRRLMHERNANGQPSAAPIEASGRRSA